MRILFITSNRLGDAILSSGLLAAFRERYPEARFTIACGPLAAPLFSAMPGLERLIPMPKRKHSLHWFDLWKRCVPYRWSLVIDLRGSMTSYLLWTKQRLLSGKADDSLHRVEFLSRVAGLESVWSPQLWLSDAQTEKAQDLIPRISRPDGGPATQETVIGIGPTANWRGKQWRAAFFAELQKRLTQADSLFPNARIAVFAADQERDQAQPVLEAIPEARRIDLIGKIDPLEALACLRRCDLFIGHDSGLSHLAAAGQVPTLALFGPGKPHCYRPWGPKSAIVTTQHSPEELISAPDYNYKTTDSLMDSLTVSMVERAVRDLWHKTRTEPC